MTTAAVAPAPPRGAMVRVRPEVLRLAGGRLLVGGSPLRALHLSPSAMRQLGGDTMQVRDATSAKLARKLLESNIADPVLTGALVRADLLTVVIPVRDRPDQLRRALQALGSSVRIVVVDDASVAPAAVAQVARESRADLVTLADNRGPAGARNAGLVEVRTPFVAFVDSDVQVSARTLLSLARHLDDPAVALVGPLVEGRATREAARWFELHEASACSLSLGTVPGVVRSGAAVGWLPGACLVGRTTALEAGFDPYLRVGEDVDLVWRLNAAGHVVRYDPTHVARHDARTTVRGWLGRKYVYGTGAAALARRHPGHLVTAVLSPAMAVSALALLLRRTWSLPIAAVGLTHATYKLRRMLPCVPGRDLLAARLGVRGLGWALRQESALVLRHWWPVAALACSTRRGRRIVTSALLVDAVTSIVQTGLGRPREFARLLVCRRLEDLAYGSGLWAGSFIDQSLACLKLRLPSSSPSPTLSRNESTNCTSRIMAGDRRPT